MTESRLLILICAALVTATTQSANASFVSLTGFTGYNYNAVSAWNYTQDGHADPTATSFAGYWSVYVLDGQDYSFTASAAGSRGTMTTNFSAPDVNTVVFSTIWDFIRGANGQFGNAVSGNASVSFVAEEDLTYALSGTFSNSHGLTEFDVRIADRTDQVTGVPNAPDPLGPFLSYQSNWQPDGASFVLGSADNRYLNGTLVGTLLKGHYYSFSSSALSYGGPDDGATAAGALTLTLTRQPVVTPEPTSLALAGFAGIGMAAGAWRRRRQQKQAA